MCAFHTGNTTFCIICHFPYLLTQTLREEFYRKLQLSMLHPCSWKFRWKLWELFFSDTKGTSGNLSEGLQKAHLTYNGSYSAQPSKQRVTDAQLVLITKHLLPLLVERGQLRTITVSGYLPTRKLVAVRVSAAWPFSLMRVVVFPFSQLFWQLPLVQVTLQMLGVKTTLMRPVWFPTVSGGKEKKKNKQITLVSIDFLQKVFGEKKKRRRGRKATGLREEGSLQCSLIDLQWCLWNRSRKLSKQNSGIRSKTTFKVKSLEWD